jgi:uncharacterized protein YhbP (UPF0306 family)
MNIKLANPKFPSDKLLTSVSNILNENELCSMATVTDTGESYIHTAYFCYSDALDLYFISDRSAKHSKNVEHSQSMAVAVFDTHQPWNQPHRGVQLFGKTWMASVPESAKALAIHAARFHAYGDYIKALNPLELMHMPHKFYVFRPETVKVFDEPQFGEETFVTADVIRS